MALPKGFTDRVIKATRAESSVALLGTTVALVRSTGRQREYQDVMVSLVRGQDALSLEAPGGAEAVLASSDAGLVLVAVDLRQAPGGSDYQLWLIDKGLPTPGPTFDVDDSVVLVESDEDLAGYEGAAITVEPDGRSRQPTLPLDLPNGRLGVKYSEGFSRLSVSYRNAPGGAVFDFLLERAMESITHLTRCHDYGTVGDRQPEDFGIGRLFRHVRDAVIVGDAKSERIVLWNECATHIFGYSEEDALELHLHDLVPASLRCRHRAGLARYQDSASGPLLDSGKPVDLWGLHRDGHEVPIELTLTAIPDIGPDGERFALAIVRDASDRHAAEEARRRLEQEDLSRRQALELNDRVVQGLVAAKAALELGRTDEGMVAISTTLDRAKAIVSGLLADISPGRDVQPGDLVRESPASVVRNEDEDVPGAEG